MSSDIGFNLFDVQHLQRGWVNECTEEENDSFFTSDFLEVTPGDTLCFGAAITTQWWHMVAYDSERHALRRITVYNGLAIFQRLGKNTAIMTYVVEDDVHFVRVICDALYKNVFLLTKNHVFTADEYRALMTTPRAPSTKLVRTCNPEGWILILNCHGSGRITVGEQNRSFAPHTLTAVPPNVPIYKESDEGFSDLHLCVDTFAPGELSGKRALFITDDDNHSIESLMRLMLRLFWNPSEHSQQLLEQLYSIVEQNILWRLEEENSQNSCVNRIVNAIQKRFDDPDFSIGDVFAAENYSSNHLRRLFRSKMGCSPVEYLLDLRINYAKKWIQGKSHLNASVAQIAAMSGFRDPCYFSRAFKRRVGCSPLAFMRTAEASESDKDSDKA